MNKIRMENTADDFKRRGIEKDTVAIWEDGRRDDDRAGAMEWWYFDAIMDDGKKVTVHFHTKQPNTAKNPVANPQAGLAITLPDGTVYKDEPFYKPNEVSYSPEQCDIHFGPHWAKGNIKHYDIHFENQNGIGADLKIDSLSSPFRPGTAYYDFGDGKYYTWFCVVPKGRVTGTITYNGKVENVTGYAYHDHQWLNINSMEDINHWVWARQAVGDDYTILNFDIVTSRNYDYQRLPIFVLEDHDGNVIFECTDPENMTCHITEEYAGHEGKDYPKTTIYTYHSNGMTAEYTLRATHENYVMDVLNVTKEQLIERFGKVAGKAISVPVQAVLKNAFVKKGIRPSYANYSAIGHLILKKDDDTIVIDVKSNLIYEFVFMGVEYKKFMERNTTE